MKLRVIASDKTPENCVRRVVLLHDEGYNEWVRDAWDMTFLLWSNCRGKRGDTVFNPVTKKREEVDSPFEPILDEDGFETGKVRLKEGIIAFPVDIYEHSGIAWALSGTGGPCFSCPWDTTPAAFWLYVDKERWDRRCGNCEWKFIDGKPSPELLEAARKVASDEINAMNLCEEGAYYGYSEELRYTTAEHTLEITDYRGKKKEVKVREVSGWDDSGNSCWGFLTDKPAEEVEFPVGCPVVSDNTYLIGDTFEQECWAFRDTESGKYVDTNADGFNLTDNPELATLWASRKYPDKNKELYEKDTKLKLELVDVTEAIWSKYPECKA